MEKRHRPGPLKQSNKAHKAGKHRSKGELSREAKGRVAVIALSKKNKRQLCKEERRNQAKQSRKLKREEALNKRRGVTSLPVLTVILPLSEDVDAVELLRRLVCCHDDEDKPKANQRGIWHMHVSRYKQRFSFFLPDPADRFAVLDAVKVADRLLLVTSPHEPPSPREERRLTELFALGLPSTLLCAMGFKELSMKQKSAAHQMWNESLIHSRFPDQKVHVVDNDSDALLLLRAIAQSKHLEVRYRDTRPHLLAEQLEYCPSETEPEVGTLRISGYLRGQPLSVNNLLHVSGWGDFQMLQLDAPDDPHLPSTSRRRNAMDMEGDVVRVLERADPRLQTSLQREAEVDPMQQEQTWPTEEELREAAEATQPRKVPRGYSEYQAAWIEDEEDVEEGDLSSLESEEDMEMAADEDCLSQAPEETEAADDTVQESTEDSDAMSLTGEGRDRKYDAALDLEQEQKQLDDFREARLNQMFPDEVDTPGDIAARIRFQRYRGLQSFRTSPWDRNESLPQDYQRIFRFRDFTRMRRAVLKEQREGGAQPGWYITIHVDRVPLEFYAAQQQQRAPVTVFGLLPHEHRMSVVHLVLRRARDPCGKEASLPVRSKQPLLIQAGCRRYTACPVYSQHDNGDKHKMERFLPEAGACVASVFAPVTYPPAPVLAYLAQPNSELLATGSVLSTDPDRLIIKRTVLSGHPFKCNKKSAVIRYMFFNREDIAWFKAIELRTKYGRRGHIKEPLGTHGHFKSVFDGQMKSQDTVLLNLYKRVFPKWSYEPTPDASLRMQGATCEETDIDKN